MFCRWMSDILQEDIQRIFLFDFDMILNGDDFSQMINRFFGSFSKIVLLNFTAQVNSTVFEFHMYRSIRN